MSNSSYNGRGATVGPLSIYQNGATHTVEKAFTSPVNMFLPSNIAKGQGETEAARSYDERRVIK
jgi:hypothetical protein